MNVSLCFILENLNKKKIRRYEIIVLIAPNILVT